MAASNGNCFICGKTTGKLAIKNHILKDHNGDGEPCYLLKAEGAYDKDYWIFFSVPLDASLSDVDRFLRKIWCECCGHMSAFSAGGREFGMARKLMKLNVGDTLLYEYDFGTTTRILITVVDKIERVKQIEKIQLLARNIPAQMKCSMCGAPAMYVDVTEGVNLCDECSENSEDGMLMSITNSPRCGACNYDGELDIWTFDPNRPFPRPQKK
jgi:Zn finger protein HypA/HybF involved in hydrogenase expression